MIPLLTLLACGGPPAGIPDTPGTIDAAVLPNLVTVGSPDLPFLLWLTLETLETQDWRACPSVYHLEGDGLSVKGDDCVDSNGIQWFGSASILREGARTTATFRQFGPDDSVGGWKADGTVSVTLSDFGTGYLIDTNVAVESLANGASLLLWADTESAYTTYGGIWYADRHDGTVGVQSWGVADIATRNTPLAFAYDCGWAAHIAGSEGFEGANNAFIDYHSGAVPVSLPPPDTGTSDTGSDTGADTGDTSDSGDTGDTGEIPDFDEDDQPDGICGACRDASIDGESLDACIDLERSLSWPFPPPF